MEQVSIIRGFILFVILTVCRQLYHQLVVVGLGSAELVLNRPLVLVSKHLGAVAAHFELLKVSLQVLDNLSVFLGTHPGELHTHKHYVSLRSKHINAYIFMFVFQLPL